MIDSAIGNNTSDNNVSHQHFKMYKPVNVLSQFVFNHHKRRKRTLLGDYIKDTSLPQGIMAIGRLDEASEGLLLLTTDGKLSKKVRERDIEKEYWVQVSGRVTEYTLEKLRKGVEITLPGAANGVEEQGTNVDERKKAMYKTLPCKSRLLDTELVEVTMQIGNASKSHRETKEKNFKGTCNKCGKAGHKSKVCPIHKDVQLNKNNNNKNGVTRIRGKNADTIKMSLPSGIPPSNRIALSEESQHGPTTWISIVIIEGKNRQVRLLSSNNLLHV